MLQGHAFLNLGGPKAAWESLCPTPCPSLHSPEDMERFSFLFHPLTSLCTQSSRLAIPRGRKVDASMSQSRDSGSRVRAWICQNSGEARFKNSIAKNFLSERYTLTDIENRTKWKMQHNIKTVSQRNHRDPNKGHTHKPMCE